jgi:hypothetical protein
MVNSHCRYLEIPRCKLTASKELVVNTRIAYRYTDKTNCKQYTSIILEGSLTWGQIEPYLAKNGYFIPGQVGMEDLQYRFALPGADHPWHQILIDDLKTTELPPTVPFNTDELARRFANTTWAPDLQTAALSSIGKGQTARDSVLSGKADAMLSSIEDEKSASRRWPGTRSAKKTTARGKE